MGCCESKVDPPYIPKEILDNSLEKSMIISGTISSFRESYTILKALGSGSLGSVYLVRDNRNGLERVAKELVKTLMDDLTIEKFFNELSILRNIVFFYIVSSKYYESL